MLPNGDYRWELTRGGEPFGREEASVRDGAIVAARASLDGLTRHEAAARLDELGNLAEVTLRYHSSLFRRDALYRVDGDNLRGSVSTVAGRNDIVIKLGRFREIQPVSLKIFQMLILAHVRTRGQSRWTGRVAVIDPSSLAAMSLKQTCRQSSVAEWVFEARMGDSEEIQLDQRGVIVRCRDNWGGAARLLAALPAA